MARGDTEEDFGCWEIEAQTRPGTPKAKCQPTDEERIVRGPGVYSDVFEQLGPLTIRTRKA